MARGFGGDGLRDASPLQCFFRDVNTLAVHAILDLDTATETVGRQVLDVPVADPLI
jgi:3-hydroxy-9,10-secoandrosta-1,3,5(10)-triene-9,17-dione monooxygenase